MSRTSYTLAAIERDVVSKRHAKAPFDARYTSLVGKEMDLPGGDDVCEVSDVTREVAVRCSLIQAQVQTLQKKVKVLSASSPQCAAESSENQANQGEVVYPGEKGNHLVYEYAPLRANLKVLRESDDSSLILEAIFPSSDHSVYLVDVRECDGAENAFSTSIDMEKSLHEELLCLPEETCSAQDTCESNEEQETCTFPGTPFFRKYLRYVKPFCLSFCNQTGSLSNGEDPYVDEDEEEVLRGDTTDIINDSGGIAMQDGEEGWMLDEAAGCACNWDKTSKIGEGGFCENVVEQERRAYSEENVSSGEASILKDAQSSADPSSSSTKRRRKEAAGDIRPQERKKPNLPFVWGSFTPAASVNYFKDLEQTAFKNASSKRNLKISADPASLLVPGAPASCSQALNDLFGGLAKPGSFFSNLYDIDDVDDDPPSRLNSTRNEYHFTGFEDLINSPSMCPVETIGALAASVMSSRSRKRKARRSFDASDENPVEQMVIVRDYEQGYDSPNIDLSEESSSFDERKSVAPRICHPSSWSQQDSKEVEESSSRSSSFIRTQFRELQNMGKEERRSSTVQAMHLHSIDALASRIILPIIEVKKSITSQISPPHTCSIDMRSPKGLEVAAVSDSRLVVAALLSLAHQMNRGGQKDGQTVAYTTSLQSCATCSVRVTFE